MAPEPTLQLRRLAVAALAVTALAALGLAQEAAPRAAPALVPSAQAAPAQVPAAEAAVERPAADVFLDRLEAAWQTRSLAAWTALREYSGVEERTYEEALLRSAFASDETVFTFLRRPQPRPDATRFSAEVQVFLANEPQARVLFWTLHAERRTAGWVVVARQEVSQMDGLVHLALGATPWRVRDFSLRFADFVLDMEDGTLFATDEPVGPTLLVFVGRARVRFAPGPQAEREQLRQFGKTPTIDRQLDWAFVRMHPDDFRLARGTRELEAEPDPGRRRDEAEKVFRERSDQSFIVDAPLPRSPWWLMPAMGDAVVDFPWGRKHVLTYALTSNEVEDVNLFDRARRLQICSYPSSGGEPHYSEDDGRALDVLEHDLVARFEPRTLELRAEHRMRVRLQTPVATVRLRLDDDLRVASVQSASGQNLLFFRVRNQGTIVVSLGPLASQSTPFTLVTRYAGRHDPAPLDQELVQVTGGPLVDGVDVFMDKPPIVYANRTAWYPRPPNEDFATARLRLETPEDWLAVTGGELVSSTVEAGRRQAEYRLAQPGKFLTALVGRLTDVGLRQQGEQRVRGYASSRLHRNTQELLPDVEQVLAFYAERFGPAPYPSLGVVLAEGEVPAGHSPPGLLYLQQRPPIMRSQRLTEDPANFSDLEGFFMAHEAAHQWFGQGTAPANYRERWLSEAWAQYCAALWLRERLGEGAFFSMMDRMARWAFRHDDTGPIHLGQRLGHLKGEPRYFRAVVYDKGAWVLHMLRGVVGDEAFFAGAQLFLRQHRYDKAGTEDLRAALEAASGQDLRAYFERWVYETGLPLVWWTSDSDRGVDGGYRTTVALQARAFPGPLPLQLRVSTESGDETRVVRLAHPGASVTIDTLGKPRKVELNEDRGLLVQIERGGGPPQR